MVVGPRPQFRPTISAPASSSFLVASPIGMPSTVFNDPIGCNVTTAGNPRYMRHEISIIFIYVETFTYLASTSLAHVIVHCFIESTAPQISKYRKFKVFSFLYGKWRLVAHHYETMNSRLPVQQAKIGFLYRLKRIHDN